MTEWFLYYNEELGMDGYYPRKWNAPFDQKTYLLMCGDCFYFDDVESAFLEDDVVSHLNKSCEKYYAELHNFDVREYYVGSYPFRVFWGEK